LRSLSRAVRSIAVSVPSNSATGPAASKRDACAVPFAAKVPSRPVSEIAQTEVVNASWGERLDIFHGVVPVFLVAFIVTLLVTPLCRRFAVANGIIDRPDEVRKNHKFPIAYLGGLAVFMGLLAAVAFSYVGPRVGLVQYHQTAKFFGEIQSVPLSIVIGMTVIMIVGLIDDVADISPWQKVGGQLFGASMLAYGEIGTKLAGQILSPVGTLLGNPDMKFVVAGVPVDVVYWVGTALIAAAVMGACNASNLIDGLDGLLSGVTAIAGIGLLVISLGLAASDDGLFDHARLVLCMALIGASLGFLPHNFNPAVIFLGDCGSLLLGYVTIVIVLSLGDTGQTSLVLAGLVIYALPIIDTSLAIVRRKLAGKKLSEGDDQHLHHMLKRALGVKGAALAIYAMGFGFAALGVLMTLERARVSYVIVVVLASFIGVIAIKTARRKLFEEQARKLAEWESRSAALSGKPDAPGKPAPPPGRSEDPPLATG
ncbi:MAG: undecaprenyl/decaprenyl-phosphate alpha-N-acetylglucosaminyl 1-phosphate transferase, partial [Phycisphaerales bacterium]|nr:undecaprenyl/decaprenyl-phosphate alpha-N-acetylglucosaminyl 1-phosphate transferase [Phycisphaerales bacterium]